MRTRIKEAKTVVNPRRNDHAQKTSPSAGNKLNTMLTANSAFISPIGVSRLLTYILMLACAVSVTYWLMRVAQVPSAPGQSALGMNKGMTLYSNQDASAAYDLFGNKPLVTENIYLQGIVVTSKNKDGSLDGFAIFEIDGKPTNAISVGEGLGKGLTLHSIGDESATLLYQGQKLDFKLHKSGPAKGNQSAKGASKK
ncbi:hypothetical protein [Polynucleobacter arcticus]|nr:hypothetical protein [Polynucleobacter arcticus]